MNRALTDECRITEDGPGEPVWNEAEGRYEDPPAVTVSEGGCIISILDTSERVVEVGGEPITLRTLNIELHYDAVGDIKVGQGFEVTASVNRHLVGRTWHIIDIADGSWAASRRLTIKEALQR